MPRVIWVMSSTLLFYSSPLGQFRTSVLDLFKSLITFSILFKIQMYPDIISAVIECVPQIHVLEQPSQCISVGSGILLKD